MPTTTSPRASSASTTCDPMKPAAPVTTTFSATRFHPLGGEAGEIVDRLLKPLANSDFWLPAEHRARTRYVRLADLRVVLRQRSLDERRGCLRQLAHHLGELSDSVLIGIADVRWIGIAVHEQTINALDLIGNVAEASRLRAVAVNRDRLVAKGLHDEVRHDAAITRPHPRPVGVEDADDAGVESVKAMVGHRERLGEALRLVVHAARAHRIDVAPVRLGLRVNERIPLHLARRREKKTRAFFLGESERVVCSEGADLERRDRQLEIVDRARGAREVEHAVELALHVRVGRDVVVDELVALLAREMGDVVGMAGDEVVEAYDFVPVRQKSIGEVRPEKPGWAGDQ